MNKTPREVKQIFVNYRVRADAAYSEGSRWGMHTKEYENFHERILDEALATLYEIIEAELDTLHFKGHWYDKKVRTRLKQLFNQEVI